MGQGDQIREHQAGVTFPTGIRVVPKLALGPAHHRHKLLAGHRARW